MTINETVERANCKIDYNLLKRAENAKFTTKQVDNNLLSLYALTYIVDKLRRFEYTNEYYHLFNKLRQIV